MFTSLVKIPFNRRVLFSRIKGKMMDDEFLEDEFYEKLLRLGSQAPEIREQIRDVLDRIEEERPKNE
jgi:hypothetical protein